MGWFKKDKKEEKVQIPKLPKLPELPELPEIEENKNLNKPELPKLPSFPTNSFGQKFSHDAIKNAVTGKKEEDKEDFANDLDENSLEMHLPPKKIKRKEINEKEEINLKTQNMNKGPVFIRIDKFEEGLNTFKKAKTKLSEVEKMLEEIKQLKNKEEKELNTWENELQEIKSQIQKIDTDVFSRIE